MTITFPVQHSPAAGGDADSSSRAAERAQDPGSDLRTGRWWFDGAVAQLREAVAVELALGHRSAAVVTRWRLGHALMMRDGPAGRAGPEELARAEREAVELGVALPAPTGPGRAPAVVTCRRHGRQWLLALGGRTVLADDSVGMRHLAVLLANPGREIRAADLAAGVPASPGGAGDGGAAAAQPILDDQARRAYRDRLSRLAARLEECEARGDVRGAEAAQAERDWLLAELAAATGLGGRARRFADGQERARIAVGKAIRRALARIAAADPVLGEELRATVRTGLRCSYLPR